MVTICNDTESGFHYWSGISAWPHKFTAKSFVPRPPPFIPSVCVHNNTREWKTSKKLGRFESVHHVSRRKVDIRGRGWYSQICNVLNLKVSILRVKMSNFDHAKVWSPKLQYRTCEILSSVLFWQLGPSPPSPTWHPPDVIECFQVSLFFTDLPLPCIIVNTNGR